MISILIKTSAKLIMTDTQQECVISSQTSPQVGEGVKRQCKSHRKFQILRDSFVPFPQCYGPLLLAFILIANCDSWLYFSMFLILI